MNRRTFFQRTIGALAAAIVAPMLAPVVQWKSRLWSSGTYEPAKQRVTWTVNPNVPLNQVYFLSQDGPYLLTPKGAERLWSDL